MKKHIDIIEDDQAIQDTIQHFNFTIQQEYDPALNLKMYAGFFDIMNGDRINKTELQKNDYKKEERFLRQYYPIELLAHMDDVTQLLIMFGAHENIPSLYADIQNAKQLGVSIDTNHLEKTITSLLAFFAQSVLAFSDAPIPDERKKENIQRINAHQKALLEKSGIEIVENDSERTLVLYFRSEHDLQMDYFEFLISAWALYQYISSGKSKIFSRVTIVSRCSYIYPEFIHSLCPKLTYNDVSGVNFERKCAIFANTFLHSSNSSELLVLLLRIKCFQKFFY